MNVQYLIENPIVLIVSTIIAAFFVMLWFHSRTKNRALNNRLKWSIEAGELPMVLTKRGHQAPVLLWVFLALFPLVLLPIAVTSFVGTFIATDPTWPGIIFVGSLVLIAPFFLFLGNQWCLRKRIEINRDFVIFEFKDIKRTDGWTEPLSNYQGVRLRVFEPNPLRSFSGLTWHIELLHPDVMKRIVLFSPHAHHLEYFDSEEVKKLVARYSRILNRPVLETKRSTATIEDLKWSVGNLTNH